MSSSLGRLAKLERENVELNEEILRLKTQLLASKMAGTPPGTPKNAELESSLASLKEEVLLAVKELQRYRVVDPGKEQSSSAKVVKGWDDDLDLDDILN